MTPNELNVAAASIFGAEWRTPLARHMGVNIRTVRRWANGQTDIPAYVLTELTALQGAIVGRDRPVRDKWICGQSAARDYLIHTGNPRFIARICWLDGDKPASDQVPVDTTTGVVYRNDDMYLCELSWIDAPPMAAELTSLMEQAADAINNR